jgi:NAD(P)-dependent dehydrogenase (short-subunit alcohol dehydrogenase family)
LREGLLAGVSVLVASAGEERAHGALAPAVLDACGALGARITSCEILTEKDHRPVDEEELAQVFARALGEERELDLVAVDVAGVFAAAQASGPDEQAALRVCMQASWAATRAAANVAFLKRQPPAGRIVYLAPHAGAGAHARAVGAGLENLARTLSIEWARNQITTVAILPGARSTGVPAEGTRELASVAREAAALTAYLASPAGAYFSGCALELGG